MGCVMGIFMSWGQNSAYIRTTKCILILTHKMVLELQEEDIM